MRRFLIVLGLVLGSLGGSRGAVASPGPAGVRVSVAQAVDSVNVSLAWDAVPPDPAYPTVSGYKLHAGLRTGDYPIVQDVGLATTGTFTFPKPSTPTTYYFVVTAYSVASSYVESGPSNEVAAVVGGPVQPPTVDPRCVFPTGDRTVSIFPTRLQDAVAGTRATVSFQLASPNSPITQVEVRLNGSTAATVKGEQLVDLGALWFPRPTQAGQYVLSLYAKNAYGCDKAQSTSFMIVK